MKHFFPFLEWLPLAKKYWKDDLIAGITGTIIVIPQAVAFAIIAGMPPVYGFYIAMLAPIVAALWGSSYHLISGPTTTSSIVVFSIISQYFDNQTELENYIAMTILLSFMAGVIKLLMGVLKMGKLVNFVSNSVVIGFTAGAGILIAFKQLKHIFAIQVPQGSKFYEIVLHISENIDQTNWYAFSIAIFTFFSALIIKKYAKKLSKFNMLVGMFLGTVLSLILGGESIGIQTLGEIPSHLPPFTVPIFRFDWIQKLFPGAIVLALLGLVEAVSIARSVALFSHQKLDNNQEFIGQGLSNIIPSFFSCYASSGSFTRSGVNYQAGAKTPLSAIFAALGLMLVMFFGAKYASYLPKSAMGGIIFLVAYNLIDTKNIRIAWNSSKKEFVVLMATLLGTLFLDLQFAVLIGIFLALFFYLDKTSKIKIITLGLDRNHHFINVERDSELKFCPQLEVLRIDGSIYFGALENLSNYFSDLYQQHRKFIIIDMLGVNFIDLAGSEWLTHEVGKFEKLGGKIIIVGCKLNSLDVLMSGGFYAKIGAENFIKTKTEAISKMYENMDKSICESCDIKAFYECQDKNVKVENMLVARRLDGF